MKKLVWILAALTIACGLAGAQPVSTPLSTGTPAPASAPAKPSLPGEKIAQTVSLITGVAISPLLGVGAVGAWEFYHAATPEQKARLPWFANPCFWVPALLIVVMCFIKDTAGASLSVALKKPFDVAEAIEHKISGLIALGTFVPIASYIFETNGGSGAALGLGSLGLATIDLSPLGNVFLTVVAMFAFFIVFLASNAINILILLSPFATVDAALKGFRATVLASVAASAWANPWIGAAWAFVVIAVSYLIAGWSFRLSHFGWVFIWDFLTGRCNRFQPDQAANRMFLSRKINDAPARTYGKLVRDDRGRLVFHYRPWLVLSPRTLVLPEGRYETGHGLIYSEILRVENGGANTLILLPPRYRGHEEALVLIYGLAGTREIGIRAAWKWFKGFFGGKVRATN